MLDDLADISYYCNNNIILIFESDNGYKTFIIAIIKCLVNLLWKYLLYATTTLNDSQCFWNNNSTDCAVSDNKYKLSDVKSMVIQSIIMQPCSFIHSWSSVKWNSHYLQTFIPTPQFMLFKYLGDKFDNKFIL